MCDTPSAASGWLQASHGRGRMTMLRTYGVFVLIGHGEFVSDVTDPSGEHRMVRPSDLGRPDAPAYRIGLDGIVRDPDNEIVGLASEMLIDTRASAYHNDFRRGGTESRSMSYIVFARIERGG